MALFTLAMESDTVRYGAQVILRTFPAPAVARPPMPGANAVMGNFGMSVPFQELDGLRAPVVPLADAVPISRRLLRPGTASTTARR